MTKAIWNNTVIAESDQVRFFDGNYYFPPDSKNAQYFKESSTHTKCFWKGNASYYDIVVGNEFNKDAAWYYSDPQTPAQEIKNHIAFWKGVKIEKD